MYDPNAVDPKALEADLDEARKTRESLPDYAFDVHTAEGRRQGATKREFFKTEYGVLKARQRGLFDEDVENL